jgi:hypothetical protein
MARAAKFAELVGNHLDDVAMLRLGDLLSLLGLDGAAPTMPCDGLAGVIEG